MMRELPKADAQRLPDVAASAMFVVALASPPATARPDAEIAARETRLVKLTVPAAAESVMPLGRVASATPDVPSRTSPLQGFNPPYFKQSTRIRLPWESCSSTSRQVSPRRVTGSARR